MVDLVLHEPPIDQGASAPSRDRICDSSISMVVVLLFQTPFSIGRGETIERERFRCCHFLVTYATIAPPLFNLGP